MKTLLKKLGRYLTDQKYRFLVNSYLYGYPNMHDDQYLQKKFRITMGYELDLDSPVTLNEKLQWLKLYDRKTAYTVMVDKYLVRQYIAQKIGEEYLIPLLGVWDSPDQIDFDSLPDQFVLKCNHNSGLGMCICSDRSEIDIRKVRNGLARGLRQDYWRTGREWPYKNVPRKIIAEQFLKSDAGGLTDYKIHCFNGVPKFILVCRDRFAQSGLTEDFYTVEWERMQVKRPGIPNAATPVPRPEGLEQMLRLAGKLSENIPFIRIDFYFAAGKIYFSELTFYPASGFEPYDPPEWDKTFGAWLTLPIRYQKGEKRK